MDRKITTVVGATAALIAGTAAVRAAPVEAPAVPVASNYGELLEPISNPTERLALANAQDASQRARLEQVQVTLGIGAAPPDNNEHHHHHHSNDWYMRNGYRMDNGRWVTQDYYNHHHHHHHHSNNEYNNGYNDR